MEEVIKNKEVLSVDAPEESLAGVAGVPAVDAPAVDAVDAVDAALDAPGMDAEQGVPDKAVTGVSVESVEKNAAVIEAVDAAIDGSVGAIAAAVAVAEPVGYSTRSKESFLKQKQDNVKIHPRLKPVAFKRHEYQQSGKLPLKNQISTSKDITFYNSEDYPINKRGFKYKPCIPSEALSANLYSTTEIPPYRVRPSYFDRLSGIIFNEDMDCVSTTEGWRSIRTNLGVSEGCYYMEFEILNANNGEDRSHVRIGLARKEASLEAPVGFDGYGYAIRDVNGQKVTLSRPKDFMEGGDGFRNGDVIGMLIALPSAEVQESDMKDWYAKRAAASAQAAASVSSPSPGAAASGTSSHAKKKRKTKSESDSSDGSLSATIQSHNNIVRDQIPIKYKSSLYYEQYEYTSTKKMDHLLNPVTVFGERAILEKTQINDNDISNQLPTIPNSKIIVFKNGKEIGTMFENLYSFLPTPTTATVDLEDFNTKQSQNPSYRNTNDGSLGYYPMISVYQGGIVKFNPGPEFKYPPQQPQLIDTEVKPISDRYDEKIVEEWVWDIIDEVEAEYLDSYDE